MEIRNALVVLTKIVKVFPNLQKIASAIEKRILIIRDKDEREDLKVCLNIIHCEIISF